MDGRTGIEKAVDFFDGSPSRLASALDSGVKRQNVEHWVKTGVVPAERCPAIEAATGGLVKCEDLRPDVQWAVLRNGTTTQQSAEQGA